MDYECDFGYSRPIGSSGVCTRVDVSDETFESEMKKRQEEQCAESGFYEVSSGYRKVPGDICVGGLQQGPLIYQCFKKGLFATLFSIKSIVMVAIFSAVLYFGWPIIEAVLIVLPIPDPKRIKELLLSKIQDAK